jgi:hypothetical protein
MGAANDTPATTIDNPVKNRTVRIIAVALVPHPGGPEQL